jgi:hypothetical protein
MADPEISNGLAATEWDNYPAECYEAFLGAAAEALTASEGRKRHFIYPLVDEVLDNYNAYRQMFGD